MRTLMRFLAAAVAAVVLAGCQPRPTGEWAGLIHPETLRKVGLQYYWHVPVLLERRETLVALHQLDENVYCLTDRNRLLAISAPTGVPKWSHRLAEAGEAVFRPAHADGVTLPDEVVGIGQMLSSSPPAPVEPYDVVVINTLSSLLVLDRSDGRVIRQVPLVPAASSGGDTDGVEFFVPTANGVYYGIALAEAVKTWSLSVEAGIAAPLECFAGRLYVASRSGRVHAIRLGVSPEQQWSQRTNGPITAPFHVDPRGCFVGCHDKRIYAYDAYGGRRLWEPFICRSPVQDPIQVGQTSLFQWVRHDQLYAIDLATGRARWSMPEGRLVLAVMEGNVYLLDDRNHLRIVDEMLGRPRSILPMTGFDLFAPNTRTQAIYTATKAGRVCCLRPLNAGHLTVEMLTGGAQ